MKAVIHDGIQMNTVGRQSMMENYKPFEVLRDSAFFGKLKTCFDQVKINAIKIRLIPTAITMPDKTFIQTVIAWDRNFATTGGGGVTFDDACSYGSAKIGYVTGSTKTTLTHFIAAETIGEKTQYLDTENIMNGGAYHWKPELIFGIRSPAAVVQGQEYSMIYAIEWTFDLTFRGTRAM